MHVEADGDEVDQAFYSSIYVFPTNILLNCLFIRSSNSNSKNI